LNDQKRPAAPRATPWRTSTEERVAGALGELPAYVRRARGVEEAIERFHEALAREREERLEITALKVRRLVDLGDEALAEHGGDLDRDALAALVAELAEIEAYRRVRARPARTRPADVARAIREVRRSVVRFNEAWEAHLAGEEPYALVNERIDGYNRWYALERQCALRYVPVNRVSFAPIEPVTPERARARHPGLPCP